MKAEVSQQKGRFGLEAGQNILCIQEQQCPIILGFAVGQSAFVVTVLAYFLCVSISVLQSPA